jgi:hypothetical protein
MAYPVTPATDPKDRAAMSEQFCRGWEYRGVVLTERRK